MWPSDCDTFCFKCGRLTVCMLGGSGSYLNNPFISRTLEDSDSAPKLESAGGQLQVKLNIGLGTWLRVSLRMAADCLDCID